MVAVAKVHDLVTAEAVAEAELLALVRSLQMLSALALSQATRRRLLSAKAKPIMPKPFVESQV